jgi:hypothetical protein
VKKPRTPKEHYKRAGERAAHPRVVRSAFQLAGVKCNPLARGEEADKSFVCFIVYEELIYDLELFIWVSAYLPETGKRSCRLRRRSTPEIHPQFTYF